MAWITDLDTIYTPTVGTRPTKAYLDAINDNFLAEGQAWTTYTPTWTATTTNPAIGNGTLVGAYRKIGKTLNLRIQMLAGSTTTFGSGTWSFSLPSGVTAVAGVPQTGLVWAIDSGTAYKIGAARVNASATTLQIMSHDGTGAWAAAVPHTWASSDEVVVNLTIEVA